MNNNNQNIVGLRELRENTNEIIKEINKGKSFTIFKRSKPLFKISPLEEDSWEEVVDFTKIRKGGVDIDDILKRI